MNDNNSCNHINKNCFVVSRTGIKPFRRCDQCNLPTRRCLGMWTSNLTAILVLLLMALVQIESQGVRAGLAAACILVIVVISRKVNSETDEMVNTSTSLSTSLKELELAHKALEQKNSEIVEAKAEADRATKAKSSFLANISHEIRTPLTVILGYAESLKMEGRGSSQLNRNEATNAIIRNSQHLYELINDTLDMSKIEADHLKTERIKTSLFDVLSDVQSTMQSKARDKNLGFFVEYNFPLPATICSDPTRIKQILVNLCTNAIKFTERGYVRVVISWNIEEHLLVFQVIDTGIGIAKEQKEVIFQPFIQADNSTTRKYGGTGLGLHISKRFAEMLGGYLNVKSEINRGSKFEFAIDIGMPDALEIVETTPPQKTETSSDMITDIPMRLQGHILIVEDNPDNQRLISMLVQRTGLSVDIAENGREAIRKVEQDDYDAIFLDIQMPVMDGVETSKALRAMQYKGPVIALTANVLNEERDRALHAGCDMCLAKPIKLEEFYSTINRYFKPEKTNSQTTPAMQAEKRILSLQEDEEFQEIVQRFLENLPEQVEKMKKAIEQSNWGDLQAVAHNVKGTAKSFGYPEVTDMATDIDAACKRGEYDIAANTFNKLYEFCEPIGHYNAQLQEL